MYKLEIAAVGKLKDFARAGCDEYLKRLRAFAEVKETELPEAPLGRETPGEIAAALLREEPAFLKRMQGARSVALCVEGQELTSEQLAQWLKTGADSGMSQTVFLIGSSHGLSDTVKQRADLRLSLSKMTLPHALARLVLAEQLYRAMTIINNRKYHK